MICPVVTALSGTHSIYEVTESHLVIEGIVPEGRFYYNWPLRTAPFYWGYTRVHPLYDSVDNQVSDEGIYYAVEKMTLDIELDPNFHINGEWNALREDGLILSGVASSLESEVDPDHYRRIKHDVNLVGVVERVVKYAPRRSHTKVWVYSQFNPKRCKNIMTGGTTEIHFLMDFNGVITHMPAILTEVVQCTKAH